MERAAESSAANDQDYVRAAHRSVSVNWLASALAGAVLTAGLYAVLISIGPESTGMLHRYFVGELGVPVIQILITALFFTSASVLVFKWRNIRFQNGGFGLASDMLPEAAGHSDTSAYVGVPDAVEFLRRAARTRYLLVARLAAGFRRLRNTGSSSGVDDVMRAIADVDRDMSQTSYTFLRFTATIIPVLGFLGTVFGISLAIVEFTVALEGARSFNSIRPDLLRAVANLGLAFNTTLLALFFSGIVLAAMTFVQKREEELLASIERYCIDHLVVQLRPPSMSDSLEQAIRESATRTKAAIEEQTSHLKQSSARIEGSLKSIAQDLRSEAQSIGKSLGDDLNKVRRELAKAGGAFASAEDSSPYGAAAGDSRRAAAEDSVQTGREVADALQRVEQQLAELGPQIQALTVPLLKVAILGHRLKSHEISDMREADAILARLLEDRSDDA